ncbi:MAG: RrF2 family transcriptional regulator [Acidimicrobiales bacterium]
MNLTLSKRGDYVVRSAICLARAYESGIPRKLRQVSAEMGVPRTFVSQILGDLVHAGIAVSSFGKAGGYRLARPPAEVSLLQIVEAGEGPLTPAACALGEGPCHWEAVCPLHESWNAAAGALGSVLSATSLGEITESDRAIEAGTYPIPADAHRRWKLAVPSTRRRHSVPLVGLPPMRSRVPELEAGLGRGLRPTDRLRLDDGLMRPSTEGLSETRDRPQVPRQGVRAETGVLSNWLLRQVTSIT